MRIAPLLAAFAVAIGMSLASAPSQAAPLAPLAGVETNQSLATPVGYYWRHRYWRPYRPVYGGGYCWRWRNICANRWGWGTWRHRRCVVGHGC